MAKRKTKKRKTGGVSHAGRPKAEGRDRYANGRLKPERVAPNERVLEARGHLCADIRMATVPLDCMLANGFITTAQHKLGSAYASVHRAAGLGTPGLARGTDLETPTTGGAFDGPVSEMDRKEIAAIFDRVFDIKGVATDEERETQAARALDLWQAMNAPMRPEVQQEAHLIFIRDSFPQWLIWKASGKTREQIPDRWWRHRTYLDEAFRIIASALKGAKAKTQAEQVYSQAYEPLRPAPVDRAGKVEQTVLQVDEGGQLEPKTSERGRAFEEVRLYRRS